MLLSLVNSLEISYFSSAFVFEFIFYRCCLCNLNSNEIITGYKEPFPLHAFGYIHVYKKNIKSGICLLPYEANLAAKE